MYEYLIHTGIKGQKWGVRRFQNKDGTWTPAGKKRRAAQEGYSDHSGKKTEGNKKKDRIDISSLSDKELQAKVDRLKLEEEYRTYILKANPKKNSRIKKIVAQLLENAAMKAGNKAIDAMTNKMFQNTKPKDKPIDLDSLTVEDLKKMNKDELEKVNKYAEEMSKARRVVLRSNLLNP